MSEPIRPRPAIAEGDRALRVEIRSTGWIWLLRVPHTEYTAEAQTLVAYGDAVSALRGGTGPLLQHDSKLHLDGWVGWRGGNEGAGAGIGTPYANRRLGATFVRRERGRASGDKWGPARRGRSTHRVQFGAQGLTKETTYIGQRAQVSLQENAIPSPLASAFPLALSPSARTAVMETGGAGVLACRQNETKTNITGAPAPAPIADAAECFTFTSDSDADSRSTRMRTSAYPFIWKRDSG
ncbi:hypothetical protein FB451DRAFT_1190383 [Mycena latifolia]|nr:hypothetical protein FB451DRAFT_1190383 [Mycena latifolia]